MARKANPTYALAVWFVIEILQREWKATDMKGMHLQHAKSVLKDYPEEDVRGCLLALSDQIIGNGFRPTTIAAIRYGEPPFIQQWLDYKASPPPVYLEGEYQDWLRRTGREGTDQHSEAEHDSLGQ